MLPAYEYGAYKLAKMKYLNSIEKQKKPDDFETASRKLLDKGQVSSTDYFFSAKSKFIN